LLSVPGRSNAMIRTRLREMGITANNLPAFRRWLVKSIFNKDAVCFDRYFPLKSKNRIQRLHSLKCRYGRSQNDRIVAGRPTGKSQPSPTKNTSSEGSIKSHSRVWTSSPLSDSKRRKERMIRKSKPSILFRSNCLHMNNESSSDGRPILIRRISVSSEEIPFLAVGSTYQDTTEQAEALLCAGNDEHASEFHASSLVRYKGPKPYGINSNLDQASSESKPYIDDQFQIGDMCLDLFGGH
jgi:hypothetical protein